MQFSEILVIAGLVILLLCIILLFRLAAVIKNATAQVKKHSDKTEAKTVPAPVTQAPAKPAQAPLKAEAPVKAQKPEPKAKDDLELVAVLTAAVAAYLGKPEGELIVRSYRRIRTEKPVWNKAGRYDQINSF